MKFEIELSRENVTLSQFLAYVRHYVDKRGGQLLRSDLDTAYIRRGDDLNFNITHDDGTREKSISRPYEAQTYIKHPSGATYNEIVEFTVDTRDGMGHGYYYLLNVEAPAETETAAEAAETPENATETETHTDGQPAVEIAVEAEKTPAEWEQDSDRVQAATMAALARVIVKEEATPAEDQTPATAPEIGVEGAGVAGGAEQPTPETAPEIVASRKQNTIKEENKTMNATQTKEIRTERGRAALDFIMKELNAGAFIMPDDEKTVLYNQWGDYIRAVPVATMERFANMREYRKFTRRRAWGDVVYVGKEGCKGWFNDLLNREHCKSIADGLADYVGGRAVKCCHCGFIHFIDDDRPAYRCGNCGFYDDIDEFEPQNLYDYFEDILDIEYRVSSDKSYRSCQIMVACGGPNIYIDTASRRVELYWWGDSSNWPLDSDTVAAVDEWAEEYWGCL